MATETLIDNQPSLHDKLHDHPRNESEAADEPKPKGEEAEVDALTEVDDSKEKKEIDEHDDSEKDDEDEDEGADEDEQEDEGKGSQLKKDAISENMSPVTPTSDRPTRERKVVERYSVPSPSKLGKSPASKSLVIEKGRGTQLKDIPNVAFKLSKRKHDDNLNMLHSLLFGKKSKPRSLKRNIGQFSGYVWAKNEEKQRIKVKEKIDKIVKEKLMDFCDLLNVPINKSGKKEELSVKLLEFLESPHATTDVLLVEKEQKGKKRARKAHHGKSPREASTKTPAKKKKQTPQSGKKRKPSSDVDEDEKAELSAAKDESQEDEDVAVTNNGSDDEVVKSGEEEDISKSQKSKSKQSGKEGSVVKAEAKIPSVKKTSAKATQSSEKSPKKSIPKKSITELDSASLPKSNQPDTKKLKTEKQDTKEKAAIKTSKAPGKDQAKGKSSKKTKVEEPSREDMHSVVADILKEVDFNTATLSDILRQLGTHFGLDLMHRKAEVKNIITDVINNMSDEEEGDDGEAETDGDGDVDEGKDGDVSDEDDNE